MPNELFLLDTSAGFSLEEKRRSDNGFGDGVQTIGNSRLTVSMAVRSAALGCSLTHKAKIASTPAPKKGSSCRRHLLSDHAGSCLRARRRDEMEEGKTNGYYRWPIQPSETEGNRFRVFLPLHRSPISFQTRSPLRSVSCIAIIQIYSSEPGEANRRVLIP